jgi:hypothetical protein
VTKFLVCADDVNLLSKNVNTINTDTGALLDASKEVSLEVNTERTKYMFMSGHQTAGQNYYVKVANKFFENVAKLTYLGTTLTSKNCLHEEIKSVLKLGNACYHAVQNSLPICYLKTLRLEYTKL